jgi:hypothetical protein
MALSATVREREILKRVPSADRPKMREALSKSTGTWFLEAMEKRFAPPSTKPAPQRKAHAKPRLRSVEACPCGQCGAQQIIIADDEAGLERMRQKIKVVHRKRVAEVGGGSQVRYAAPIRQSR